MTRLGFAKEIVRLAKDSGKFGDFDKVNVHRTLNFPDYLPFTSYMSEIDPERFLAFKDWDWRTDFERFFRLNVDELAKWYNELLTGEQI